ncbi:Gfo/Idh/MocA family oxidoreductase [Aliifodinibius sp. S!AR15-10]|uniref:Gfo/Idh/MocA family protein n=1 Tax=Aliifodinibius sp. S!AR15-10 TaxID=2950437 RepID=UPI0028593F52|nr:Gfo/Idh/MocA family oxidoreductase [Aliifodinibius sp. S!AR15-10]MDR8390918.1 Gfo/Idh/MocA family oxidoreductase [Aliifodinibius sp. S!AR15-10]
MTDRSTSRRNFIKTLTAGTAGLSLGLSAQSYGNIIGANDRIRVGVIGVGRQGRGLLGNMLSESDVEVVALSDVYKPNLDFASSQAPKADTYNDFREMLDRTDIDAVVIATPDHWHALNTIMACQAGKDVYVEKPLSRYIEEGRKMVEAAREHDRVVQVGTMQRSGRVFQEAVEIIQSGNLGPISFVRTWNYSNDYPDGIGSPADSNPPEGLDWDLWLGPARQRPFNINRFGVILDEEKQYQRWASFRWFWDYAGGMMTDWGVHLLDIVNWAMDVKAPQAVSAAGGKFHLKDNRETPDTLTATYQYPNFVCTYENRVLNGKPMDGNGYGIMFHGTEGTLFVDRGSLKLTPEPDSKLEALSMEVEENARAKHVRNFLDCIKSREKPICDVEVGHHSTVTAHLGNIAYRSEERIEWDSEREQVGNSEKANNLVKGYHRDPWTV